MYQLLDKFILYCFTFFFILNMDNFSMPVLFLLLSLSSTCFLNVYSYSSKPKIFISIVILNIILGLIFPNYILFLPIIIYDCVFQKFYFSCFGFLLPFANVIAYFFTNNDFSKFEFIYYLNKNFSLSYKVSFLIILLNYAIAALFALKSRKINDIHLQLIHTQDSFKENKILLERENQNILKQQDYEIHIATLNERNRIAREIHDNVGHMLSRSILQVGALIAINKDEKLASFYTTLKDSLNEAMTSIRNSVHDLHDESIDLNDAIKNLIYDFTFCKIKYEYDISQNIDVSIKYCFIAITKEALNNIMKHSNATKVSLRILEHPAFYQYIIEDNGSIENNKVNTTCITKDDDSHSGIGLTNMKERVEQLNGTFVCTKKNGFCIHISIPKQMK